MKYERIIVSVFLLTACGYSAADVQIKEKKWPQQTNCHDCVDLSVGFMKAKLARKGILGVTVLNFKTPTVDVKYTRGNKPSRFGVLMQNENFVTGGMREKGFYKKLGINNMQELFFALGKSHRDKKTISRLHDVMGIKTKYVMYKGKNASAFFIENAIGQDESLYVIPNDNKYAYLIAGELSESFVEKLLSSISFGPPN